MLLIKISGIQRILKIQERKGISLYFCLNVCNFLMIFYFYTNSLKTYLIFFNNVFINDKSLPYSESIISEKFILEMDKLSHR